MRIALFPGSFDPVTKGHVNVVLRGLELFDEVVVAIGRHGTKSCMFSVEERMEMLQATFANTPRVRIESYDGLTSDFALSVGAKVQLRGVRNATDLAYEQTIAQMTRAMHPDMDTVVLMTDPAFAPIHSTVVRDVLVHGGDASPFVPASVVPYLNKA